MGKMSLTKSPSVPDPGLSSYMSGGMSTSASVDTSIAASRFRYYFIFLFYLSFSCDLVEQ